MGSQGEFHKNVLKSVKKTVDRKKQEMKSQETNLKKKFSDNNLHPCGGGVLT